MALAQRGFESILGDSEALLRLRKHGAKQQSADRVLAARRRGDRSLGPILIT